MRLGAASPDDPPKLVVWCGALAGGKAGGGDCGRDGPPENETMWCGAVCGNCGGAWAPDDDAALYWCAFVELPESRIKCQRERQEAVLSKARTDTCQRGVIRERLRLRVRMAP